MAEEEPSLDFKEKNLSESYSVFISNAFIEYSKENVEKGKKTEFQKIRKWRKKIDKLTESMLGITLPRILIQTCDQFFETGKRQAVEIITDHLEVIPEETPQISFDFPRIGIITALVKEYNALRILLDNYKVSNIGTQIGQRIGNTYCLGKIITKNDKSLNLVLCLAKEGNTIASVNCFKLLTDFPTIKQVIMCGIAGGVPDINNPKEHVRLGDIVVSDKTGIINYDYRKVRSYILYEEEQKFDTHRPDASLLQLVNYLKADIALLIKKGEEMPWKKYIKKACNVLNIERPTEDVLRYFKSNLEKKEFIKIIFHEIDKKPDITTEELINKLEGTMERVEHPDQEERTLNEPLVFYGPIGSANIVLKDEILRDKLLLKYGIKAVEMESAGIVDATWVEGAGYLTIRGICDYCNLDKNDDWQDYAAVVAAAFTRSLLDMIDS